MPTTETIRHYPPFPVVIPVSRVGWLRVTHPFAALLTPEGVFSLDLHASSTPPTFVLSQDQTLHFEDSDSVCRWSRHRTSFQVTIALLALLRRALADWGPGFRLVFTHNASRLPGMSKIEARTDCTQGGSETPPSGFAWQSEAKQSSEAPRALQATRREFLSTVCCGNSLPRKRLGAGSTAWRGSPPRNPEA